MQSAQPATVNGRSEQVFNQPSFSENRTGSTGAAAQVNVDPRLEPEAEVGYVWCRSAMAIGSGALKMYLPRGEDGGRHLNMTSVAVSALFVLSGATLYLYCASGAELAITLTPELVSRLSFYLWNPSLIPKISLSEGYPVFRDVFLRIISNLNGGWFAWEKIKECIELIPYLQGHESERLKKKDIYMNILRVIFNFELMRSIGSKPIIIDTSNCPDAPKGICPCATSVEKFLLEYPSKCRGTIPVEIPREEVVSSCWLVSETLCQWWRVLTDGFGVTSG